MLESNKFLSFWKFAAFAIELSHLSCARTITFRIKDMKFTALLALLCVGVLLLAITAQAAHVCCVQLDGDYNASQHLRAGVNTHGICLLCLMATSVGAVAVFASQTLGLRPGRRARLPQTLPVSVLRVFSLYVRPPPAY